MRTRLLGGFTKGLQLFMGKLMNVLRFMLSCIGIVLDLETSKSVGPSSSGVGWLSSWGGPRRAENISWRIKVLQLYYVVQILARIINGKRGFICSLKPPRDASKTRDLFALESFMPIFHVQLLIRLIFEQIIDIRTTTSPSSRQLPSYPRSININDR